MDYSYYSNYSTSTPNSDGLTAAFAALGGFAAVMLVIVIALAVLTIIGQWKMFRKAGAEGYISLIPGYATIKEMRISGMPIYWFFLTYCIVIPLIGWIGPVVLAFWKNIKLANAFEKGIGTGALFKEN